MQVGILILLTINWKITNSTKVLIKTMKSQANKKSCYIGICKFLKFALNCLQNKLSPGYKFLRSLQCLHHMNRKEGYVVSKLPCTSAVEGIWRGWSHPPLLEQFSGFPQSWKVVEKFMVMESHRKVMENNKYVISHGKVKILP